MDLDESLRVASNQYTQVTFMVIVSHLCGKYYVYPAMLLENGDSFLMSPLLFHSQG